MNIASIGKIAGALFAALVATAIATAIGEFAGVALFPSDVAYIAWLPAGAKLVIVITWAMAALAGAVAARVLGERGWLAFAGAMWTLLGVLYSLAQEPYPMWMMAGGLVLPPLAGATIFLVWRQR